MINKTINKAEKIDNPKSNNSDKKDKTQNVSLNSEII